ncbi:Uncharacterised protein [Candidatus Venteria ishoeyi]|uniref:PIN domain-containing protein n=1 Tax=Candidatus Venteria ishoeyi TaxID=1899563 RepID=A0A1H6FDH0_9GAMM|nr:Uncharacterised protein [Candidatus Venteria ishoeyi]
MAYFSVVYDACVLYPAPLRDLLMRLALTDLFRAHWTDQIHQNLNEFPSVIASLSNLLDEKLQKAVVRKYPACHKVY